MKRTSQCSCHFSKWSSIIEGIFAQADARVNKEVLSHVLRKAQMLRLGSFKIIFRLQGFMKTLSGVKAKVGIYAFSSFSESCIYLEIDLCICKGELV